MWGDAVWDGGLPKEQKNKNKMSLRNRKKNKIKYQDGYTSYYRFVFPFFFFEKLRR